MGGAIYYDLYRPEMTNVVFTNNTAPHGNNIASYPVKIVQASTNSTKVHLNNVASGQENDYEIKLSVVDHDNQISSLTSGGRITISPLSENATVLGSTSASIVEGVATFNGTIFVAPPGSEKVPFKLSSTAINTNKLVKQYGKTSIQDPLTVDFRYCKPGEYMIANECRKCIAGTYSLVWNSTK